MLKDELVANSNSLEDPSGSLNQYYQSNLNELYYALNALNRLDDRAEAYLRQSPSWPDDRNGIFMRDDVGENFLTPFENDYSEIFQKDCNFQFPSSDYRSVVPYNNPDEEMYAGQVIPYNKRNVISIDQASSVLLGLRFVFQLVGEITVQPTATDTPTNLRQEARAIALRILDHIAHSATEVGGISCTIRNWDGLQTYDGGEAILFAPAIIEYKKLFEHPNYNLPQSVIDDINVAIQVDPRKLVDIELSCPWELAIADLILDQNFYLYCLYQDNVGFSCFNEFKDLVNESVGDKEMITLGHVKLGKIKELLNKVYERDIMLSTNPVLNSVPEIVSSDIEDFIEDDVHLDIWGQNCDNLPWNRAMIKKAYYEAKGLIALLDALGMGDQYQFNSIISNLSSKFNDDNIHMILELMVGSGLYPISNTDARSWIANVADHSSFDWYYLANCVLNGYHPFIGTTNSEIHNLLSAAPCEGPWDSPLTPSNALPTPNTVEGWRAANRLFHPSDSYTGIPDPSFRGEYSGIDYMVIHNLYRLVFPQEQPAFRPNFNCNCVSEFTQLEYTDATLLANKKFEQYKRQQIVSPSILAHDLTVDGALGNLTVKNDLIVCGPYPSVPTTLEVKNNAQLNLYGGMQVTVKAGNRLVITENAKIVAGISDSNFPELGSNSTILLEENAVLELTENADIDIVGSFQINMLNGAQLIINNSIVDVSTLTGTSGIRTFGENTIISINSSSLRNLNSAQKFVIESTNSCNVDIKGSQIHLLNGGFSLKNSVLNALNSYIQCEQSGYVMENCQIFLNNTPLQLKSQGLSIRNASAVELRNSNITLYQAQLELLGVPLGPSVRPTMLADQSNIFFNGSDSRFILNFATLTVAENFQMTISSPNGPSGIFEIVGNDDIDLVLANNNSSLTVLGDGKNVETIRVNNYHDFWSNNGNGKIVFRDLLVNLDNAGRIWTDSRFELYNCALRDNVISNHSGELEIWNNYLTLQYIDFYKVHVDAIGSFLNVESNTFNGKLSYIEQEGGAYRISRSEFKDGFVQSSKLERVSSISQSNFTQIEGYQDQYAISDGSLINLLIHNCSINRYLYGISKSGGELSLRCNTLEENWMGIFTEMSVLNMTTSRGAGHNNFVNNNYNLEDVYSTDYLLDRGFNSFEPYLDCNMYITSNIPGSGNCTDIFIPANNNIWSTNNNGIAIQSTNTNIICQQNTGWPYYCPIYFVDYSPVTTNDCPTGKPIVRPKMLMNSSNEIIPSRNDFGDNQLDENSFAKNGSNNLIIQTNTFQGIPLDSALTYAASYMEIYDSLGSDGVAIDLFHEILSSNLDRTNQEVRDLSIWGIEMMKTTIENMFFSNDLSINQNQIQFELPVQKYVDVLNLHTDTTLSLATYRSQFKTELMKGQLFLTLQNNYMAFDIFDNLNNCPLDSLEQSRLNTLKEKVQTCIDLQNAIQDGYSPDSLASLEFQTFNSIMNQYNSSDYYFGVHINSPLSVSFVSCGNNTHYKSMNAINYDANLYPNPTVQELYLRIRENDGLIDHLVIHDILGKRVYSEIINQEGDFIHQIVLPQNLSAGQYFLRIISPNGISKTLEFIKN
jgi:hypothetical protein